MTACIAIDVEKSPVGFLMVHETGSKKPGETLGCLLAGLRLAYGDRLVAQNDDHHAVLSGIARPVRVYEVYWADLPFGESVKSTSPE